MLCAFRVLDEKLLFSSFGFQSSIITLLLLFLSFHPHVVAARANAFTYNIERIICVAEEKKNR